MASGGETIGYFGSMASRGSHRCYGIGSTSYLLGSSPMSRVIVYRIKTTNYKISRFTRLQAKYNHMKHGQYLHEKQQIMSSSGHHHHNPLKMMMNRWQNFAIAGILVHFLLGVSPADAVDALKTYTCLLKECRVELAKCFSNPTCAANIACVEMCNNRPGEAECQIRCGDMFENNVVHELNMCAVSRKKCVPKISNVGEFPIPNPSVLSKSFNVSDFTGKWFITSGLNPVFDIYDCQLHEFHMESNKLVGNLTWRIKTPDGGFFTRSAVQKFVQDPSHPGILHNHDNEYLHYQDDWFILSSSIENKADDYVFVYYQGHNDACDSYGGAIVYSRSSVLPKSIIPKLEKAAKSVGQDFSKFLITDNSCGAEPPLIKRLGKIVALLH